MRRRALRTLAHCGRTVGLVATFAAALAGGVILHANLAGFRRAVANLGNDVMASLFDGKIVVTDVQSLSLGRKATLRLRHVEVTDPEGKRVISADDIQATIDLERLLRALAAGEAPYVDLSDARIGNADVVLDVDPATGKPKIARTFHLRPKEPSKAKVSEPPPPPKDPTLHIASASIGHAHVHGDLVPPSLDGEVDEVRAKVSVERNRARIELIDGKVTLLSPRAPNQKMPIVGVAHGSLEVPLDTVELHGNVDLKGSCGDVPVVASARIAKDEVEATVDIASVEPAVLANAFSDLPMKKAVEVHAHAHGKLPTIALDARARMGDSIVTATGEIDTREGHAFKLDVDASKIDAATFGAPLSTDVSANLHAEGNLAKSGPIGTFRVTTVTTSAVGEEKVPPALIEGRFEEKQITATLRASEPGVDANGKVIFDIKAKVMTFDVQARSTSLRALSRAPGVIGGAASARAEGKLDLNTKTIDAKTSATGDGIAFDAFTAKHVSANGKLAGPLSAPILDVTFAGEDMQLKAKDKTPLVYPHATGRARVALGPSPSVLGAEINVGEDGAPNRVSVAAKSVNIANGVVEARGLRVTGLGEPLELDARLGKGEWSIRAKSDGVDLHRASAITGIKELKILPEGTRAAIDVDVHQLPEGADGHIDVVVTSEKNLSGNPGKGATAIRAEAHAKIDRGKLVGTAKVEAEGLGQIEVTRAELEIPGRRLDARSLQRTTGTVEIRGAIDLSQGAALFAGEHVERVAGIASFEARIERGDPDALPAARGTVRTEGLELVLSSGEPGPNSNGPPKSITISGVEVLAHVAWDGNTEDGEIAALTWDRHGLLGSANAKAKVPLADWATGKKKLDANALAALDIDATADIPSREIAELPAFFDAPDLRGLIDAHVRVAGTIGHPRVRVSASAARIREKRRGGGGGGAAPTGGGAAGGAGGAGAAKFEPLDGTLEGRWDGERAVLTFALDERLPKKKKDGEQGDSDSDDNSNAPMEKAARPGAQAEERRREREARRNKAPGHLRGLVLLSDVSANDLVHGKPLNELPWKASAEVEVQNLSLAALPIQPAVTGALTGRARITDLNHNPSFELTGHVDDFGTGGARVQRVEWLITGRDASLLAHVSMNDKKGTQESKARFQLASQSLRIQGLDFEWNDDAPTRVDYVVENGRLALLGPVVRRQVSEIDGRVDGTGSITIDEKSQVFEGGLAVHEGRLYVNSFGEEITGLAATARFDRTGVFRIDDAVGKIGGGEFRASASGRMKGLHFVGVDATVIATKDGVPISSEAVTFAVATGEVKLSAKMADDPTPNKNRKMLVVTVDVPRANVELPDRGAQKLEELDPDPTVDVGVRRKNGDLDTKAVRRARGGTGGRAAGTTSTSAALPMRITVGLGDSVHIEGRGLDVSLGGKTLVEIAEELRVTGRIDLRGGTIEVHGRRFTVDRGVVTFAEGGDPGNPTVVAAAYWDAPDRTRVWVEFAGPLKSGRLTLRSEPAYSKSEILSVLLFGRPDPNMASSSAKTDSGGNAATAVGSGFVAGDLNRMLSELDENLDVETDTLSGNRTRTKLGRSFFDRRLKVQIGYAPGRTYREPDTTYVFLNWQFIPKWSLVATRGDRGTSILDVLFQHRY